ncbi:MAG TPA: cysteine--tRNA ligase [Patescibacteria group bacterium]|nr:cysteine--tRNA ligase [Patescibacteria group bacterium]
MLKIQNTLTRKKESFKPIKKNQVGFYHCGPTVYWTQHLGNMRAMVLADLMVRVLNYLGYKVKLVRNYTDVGHLTSDEDQGEDKMAKSAKAEKMTPDQIADKYIKIFEQDISNLNILDPWQKPKATDHIKLMVKMAQTLIDRGYAYATDLAIYFDISKFKNYTELSGQDLAKNISSAGKGEVGDVGKKNSRDFAVWFFKAGAHENALQTWPMKFKGIKQSTVDGFPGWHIECSAMSQKYLGDTIDIHMGGIEHVSVHHTNEIAQSEAVTGKKFVNYWLHNEHLMVDGKKMSKSEGTAYSVADIKANGYDPLVLRYFFMQAHYRSKQNFTWEAFDASQTALNNLRGQTISLQIQRSEARQSQENISEEFKNKFISAIEDDFNLPQALAVVWEVLKSDLSDGDKYAMIMDFDQVLGLNLGQLKKVGKIPTEVNKLAKARKTARQDKNWQESDRLREEIKKLGFVVEDNEVGYKLRKIG